MSSSQPLHMRERQERRRPSKALVGVLVSGLLVAAIGITSATADTTISPLEPGNVVRDDSITLTVAPGLMYSRSATSTFAYTSLLVAGSAVGCRGNLPTANNSPRSQVVVTGPGTVGVVLDKTSPVRDTSIPGAIAGYPPFATQPAPSATNYLGGLPPTASAPAGTGFTTTLNLAGKPAGIYTVTTTTKNMYKTSTLGACQIGTPTIGTQGLASAGIITETKTFEYRPWQHQFVDVFGGGSVKMNVTPEEVRQTVGGQQGAIMNGTQDFYAVPDATFIALPSDPNACVADPNSCLPSTATSCDPTAGCVPRIALVNYTDSSQQLIGVFDLETKAFVAYARVGGTIRTLMSLGTEQDASLHDVLTQLSAAAAAQGIDLATLLATQVRVSDGTNVTSLSLLNGLQISTPSGPGGVQIVSDTTVQAGLILDIYSRLAGTCAATVDANPAVTGIQATAGDSNPATAVSDRYTPSSDVGYTVQRSDYLPDVPRAGAVGALVGGPIYHITGDFVGEGTALVNTAMAVIGADTAANEPNGYPVWIEPFVSTPTHVTAPRTMDFLGTATWSASETPVAGVGCLTVDFLLGAGVALYNNPLPVGLGDIPIWDPADPAVVALIAQINAAAADAVNQASTNPTVAPVLTQVLALLPI